jgi:hypothetical protein
METKKYFSLSLALFFFLFFLSIFFLFSFFLSNQKETNRTATRTQISGRRRKDKAKEETRNIKKNKSS